MQRHTLLTALCLLAGLCIARPALASDDHDHGAESPTASGPALPRFAAVSEAFELVGVLNGKQITLYLDRAPDNSPVPDAQIELDVAGTKFKADKHAGDTFEVVLGSAPQAGVLAITATVTVGTEVDLLAGELDVHGPETAHAAPARSWTSYALWIGAALAALLALWAVARTRRHRPFNTGAAA